VLGKKTCAKNYGNEGERSFVFLQKHKNGKGLTRHDGDN
jgi:hypothetical protein